MRLLCSLLGLCLLLGCQPQATKPAPRPNILFIFTDDHALQAIGAYGSVLNKTPNIDRLAQEGMLFRHAMCTNSICAPSRAVILTGLHSHLNGVRDNVDRFDSAQVTFPKLLRASGYETAMIGKWHLKSTPSGFDYWRILPDQGHYYNPDFITPDTTERVEGYVTDLITDYALDWLAQGRDPDKPFLLMYQHKAPHREWSPGPAHLDLYDDTTFPEPSTLFDDYSHRASGAANQEMSIAGHMPLFYDLMVSYDSNNTTGWHRTAGLANRARMTPAQLAAWDAAFDPDNEAFRQQNLSGRDLTRWKYQRYMQNYLRCIASVDDNVGRVLDYLESTGLADNTIVVYSSDQGFYLGEHGWYDKRWMYEQSLHMPFIVRWPDHIRPGSVNTDLVQNLDFAPTFLDIAGVEIPAAMQGRSLLPLLQGQTTDDWRKAIYYQYYENPGVHNVPRHYGIRTDRYKLIHYYQLGEWELFDLETDPDELKSVYGDPAYAAVQQDLGQQLDALRADCGAVEP